MTKDSQIDWKAFLRTYGYYAVHFVLEGGSTPSLAELQDWMRTDSPKYTGWPPFWWPTRAGIEPQVVDQKTYECVHDGTGNTGTIERWRARTNGDFTIIRPHDLDESEPGKYINLILPVWRVAELLLYAGRMSERFHAPTIDLTVRFTGLKGRTLTTIGTPGRLLGRDYATQAEEYKKRLTVDSQDVSVTVVEVVERLLTDCYQLFQFVLPANLCEEEIARMRSHRF